MTFSASPLKLQSILVFGILGISSGSILVKSIPEVPALVIAFFRMSWAAVVLFPFLLWERSGSSTSEPLPVGALRWRVLAGVSLALHFAFWISSLKFTLVAVSVVLVNTTPVLVTGAAYFLFGEKLKPIGLLGLLCAVLGAVLLVVDDLRATGGWRGPGLALLGAAAFGVYLLCGRHLRSGQSLLQYVIPTYALAAVVLGILVVLGGISVRPAFAPQTMLVLFLLGVVPQGVGHTAFNWALGHLPVTVVSCLTLAEPVVATILAFFLLGETLSVVTAGGCLLVGIGILTVTRWGVLSRGSAR